MATAASRRYSSSRRLIRALRSRARFVYGAVFGAAVLAAVLVVATNGFHFGSETTPRSRVSAYIKQVDRVQQELSFSITQVVQAYRAYTRGTESTATLAQLQRASRTFRTLGLRTAAIPAPPQAAHLRRLLVSLLAAEHGIAVEVTGLARFTTPFHAIALQVQSLSAQLSRALAAIPQPKAHLIRGTRHQVAKAQAAFAAAAATAAGAQATVIDAYDAALAVVLTRLTRIVPPRVFRPTYAAEMTTLRTTKQAGAALAAALRSSHRADVPALSRRFTEAARIAGSVSRQREAIAAVKAFDARVKEIGTLELAVQREYQRLSNTVT